MTYAAAPLDETADRAGLQALWREVMPGRSQDGVADWRFAWYFGGNPAGAPTTSVTHHVPSKTLVACGSAYARRTQVAGELHSAGILCDFAVSKPHRVAGAALAVQRQLMAQSLDRFLFIYGCPNKLADPIFERLGYKKVATTVSYSRPLRTGQWLAPRLKHPLLARLAGQIVDAALAATDVRGWLGHPLAWRSERLARADERFDALWQRARRHYGITGERSAAYLNWRYADFKTEQYQILGLSERRGGALIGYVIYRMVGDTVLVGDLFCDEPSVVMEPLLLCFVSAMRDGRRRSVYLSLIGNDAIEGALRRALFIKRPASQSVVVLARPDAPASLLAQLEDGRSWFLVGGELDT
jgi:hypothetical protein